MQLLAKSLVRTDAGSTAQRDGSTSSLRAGCGSGKLQLRVERAGHGGNRLRGDRAADRARKKKPAPPGWPVRSGSANLLGEAGLDPVQTPEQFAARRGEITAAHKRASQAAERLPERAQGSRRATSARCAEEAEKVNAELRSLRERKNNIPKRNLDIRAAALPRSCKLNESTTPVRRRADPVLERRARLGRRRRTAAAQLRPVDPRAGRALRRRSPTGSTTHFLNGRVVYYRVPGRPASRDARRPAPAARRPATRLSAKLDVKGHAVRLLGGGRAGEPRRPTSASTTMERVPPHAAGHHAGRADQGRGRAAREGRPASASMTAARTCSAGPTSGRSMPCCGRRPRSRAKARPRSRMPRASSRGELDAAIKRGQVLAGLDQTQRVRRDRLAVDGQPRSRS